MAQASGYEDRFKSLQHAERYARRFESGVRRRINDREQRAVRKALEQLEGVGSIIDVPGGAGRFVPLLAQAGRVVIEVDVAHEMLALGRQRNAPSSRVHWVQGDACRLAVSDAAADCVFCNRLLHHLRSASERAGLLRELHRVSRRYVVVSFFDYHRFGRIRMFLKRLRGRRPNYAGQPTRRAFEEEVAQAGFRLRAVLPTGPPWVAQCYFVLEKA